MAFPTPSLCIVFHVTARVAHLSSSKPEDMTVYYDEDATPESHDKRRPHPPSLDRYLRCTRNYYTFLAGETRHDKMSALNPPFLVQC